MRLSIEQRKTVIDDVIQMTLVQGEAALMLGQSRMGCTQEVILADYSVRVRIIGGRATDNLTIVDYTKAVPEYERGEGDREINLANPRSAFRHIRAGYNGTAEGLNRVDAYVLADPETPQTLMKHDNALREGARLTAEDYERFDAFLMYVHGQLTAKSMVGMN